MHDLAAQTHGGGAVRLGAIILSGGASSRMGADKAAMDWLGMRAIDRVAEVAKAVGAETFLSVGPGDYGLARVVDEPPLGGPVGAVKAGAQALSQAGCARMLVLAVDAPTLTTQDLAPLLAADGPGAAYEGLHLPMVVEIAALPEDAQPGWPMGRLVERAGVQRLPVPPGAGERLRGANTPQERTALLAELAARAGA